MVPDGWKEENLGTLFEFKNGANTEAANYGSGIKFVNVMDVFGNHFITSEKIRERVNLPEKKINLYLLKMGDVLFNRTSEVFDEIALTAVYMDTSPAIFGGFVIRGRPKANELDFKFCIYCFSSYRVRKESIRRGQGVIRSNIGQKDLQYVPLLVPPIIEQKKIAKILLTWDRAIEVTEKLISNSQQQKKSLMQQLITGKKRLLGFSDEWEKIRLKPLLEEGKARNKDSSIQRVLSVTNHSGFVLPEDQFSKRVASSNVSNYKIVKRGEFAYNPSRINVGSFARLDDYDEGILSPMYVVFSVKKDSLFSDFFFQWMSSHHAKQRILSSTQGSVRDSVSFQALCAFPFLLPSLKEQRKIASVLLSADKEIETLQQKLEYLSQEKKALMQQLLTGKRRVKIDEDGISQKEVVRA